MTQEPQPKSGRSMTTAVLFVLLTASLIGNVFLYAHYLQNGQQERAKKGEQIFLQWKETQDSLTKAAAAWKEVQEDGPADRDNQLKVYYGMLKPETVLEPLYSFNESGLTEMPLAELLQAGQELSDSSADWPKEYKSSVFALQVSVLKTAMEGTPEEQQKLQDVLNKLVEQAAKVDTSIESRERYLTLLAEKTWKEAALEMARIVSAYTPPAS